MSSSHPNYITPKGLEKLKKEYLFLKNTDRPKVVAAVAFRMAAPAHLILLMRAFSGLLYYLDQLGESVSWSIALRPHLEGPSWAPRKTSVTAAAISSGGMVSAARW